MLFERKDVRAHNIALRHRLQKLGAVRDQVAFFRCPWPCTPAMYEKVRKAALNRWVGYMEKTGWQLMSPILDFPDKRRTSASTDGDFYGIPMFDMVDIPVAAYFKKLNLKTQRVEVPVSDE